MHLAAQRCTLAASQPPGQQRQVHQRRRTAAAAAAPPPRRRVALRMQVQATADGGSEQQPYQLDPNVWAHKPVWCQPWSIVATGGAVVAGVYALSGHSAGWTTAAALPVAAWWYLFLGVMPAQFREYAEGLNAEQQQLFQLQRLRPQQQRQQEGGQEL